MKNDDATSYKITRSAPPAAKSSSYILALIALLIVAVALLLSRDVTVLEQAREFALRIVVAARAKFDNA